ncbi:MAG: hypothetical protein KIS63_03265 [Caldilineales bacterium]|nr:hypothetical protein [Caldilineales bacterium]
MTNATGDLGGGLYRLRQTAGYLEGEPSNANLRDLPPDEPRSLVRFQAVLGMLVAFGLILAVQLVRYQVFAARSLPSQSNNVGQAGQGWTADEKAYVDPEQPRGTIVDRLGHPLALDSYYYQVAATPNIIKDARLYAATVAPWVGMDPLALEHMLAENADAAYLPLGLVGPAVGEEIMAMDVFTVTAQPLPKRYYPEGRMAAHVLGFVAGDRRGYYGLEGYYDTFCAPTTPSLLGQATATHDDRLPDSPFTPSYVQRPGSDPGSQHPGHGRRGVAQGHPTAPGRRRFGHRPDAHSAPITIWLRGRISTRTTSAVDDHNAYRNPAVNDPYERVGVQTGHLCGRARKGRHHPPKQVPRHPDVRIRRTRDPQLGSHRSWPGDGSRSVGRVAERDYGQDRRQIGQG